MERRLKTPDLFKFPYFEAICWYVAKNLLEMLKGESQMFNHRGESAQSRCSIHHTCQKNKGGRDVIPAGKKPTVVSKVLQYTQAYYITILFSGNTVTFIIMGITVPKYVLLHLTFYNILNYLKFSVKAAKTVIFSFFSELREDNCPPPTYLVEGVKALISALKTWLKREVRVGHSILTVIICIPAPRVSTTRMVIVTRQPSASRRRHHCFALIFWMCVSDQ